MAAEAPPVNFVDNPHAPEVHATAYAGLWKHAGNLHITLESARYDHGSSPGPINRVVIARLVMPIEAAKNLAENITAFLQNPGAPPPVPPASALH